MDKLYVKGKNLYIEFLSLTLARKALVIVLVYVMLVVIRLIIQFIVLYMLFKGIL